MLFNIWVSRMCNLSCTYCYEGNTKGNMDFSENQINDFLNFMHQYADTKYQNWINFHGGEPLLSYSVIQKMILALNSLPQKFHYSMTTNGTLLTQKNISELLQMGIETSVSIDGNKYTHDMYRTNHLKEGTYDIVKKNLLLLASQQKNTRVRMTFNHLTVSYLYENVQHLVGMGITQIVAAPDMFDPDWTQEDISIFEKQLELLNIYEQKLSSEDPANQISISLINKSAHHVLGTCTGGEHEISIDCNGDLYPCTYVVANQQFKIGHIKEGIDNQILNTLKKTYDCANEECEGCGMLAYCLSSRCKYLNHAIMGDFLTPSPIVCALERTKINNLVKSNESSNIAQ